VVFLKEIGDILKQAREEKGLSLKGIQEVTKIRLRYLEAIDEGDFEAIPGEVYRKGFIVNYANVIGLDGQQILQKYYDLKAAQEEQIRQEQLLKEEEENESPKTNLNNDWIKGIYLGVAGALAIVLLISFFLIPSLHNSKTEDAIKPVGIEETPETPDYNNQTLFPAPITITAEFRKRVWVQVIADGESIFLRDGRTFDASEPVQVWTAQQEMEVKIGDPSGIELTFNGKKLGPLGVEGKSKIVKFKPDGLVAP
jgi:hypothetical protein